MKPQHIFIIVWLILAVSMLLITYKKGKKALEIFPKIDSVKVLFRENRISGNSRKSFKTKYGGAKSILEVIITEDELWIRSHWIFAGFGQMFDILHKVKLDEILEAEINNGLVVISFKSENNEETTIDLKMNNSQNFVELLKNTKSVQQFI